MVSGFIFGSLIHCEFFFVCAVLYVLIVFFYM